MKIQNPYGTARVSAYDYWSDPDIEKYIGQYLHYGGQGGYSAYGIYHGPRDEDYDWRLSEGIWPGDVSINFVDDWFGVHYHIPDETNELTEQYLKSITPYSQTIHKLQENANIAMANNDLQLAAINLMRSQNQAISQREQNEKILNKGGTVRSGEAGGAQAMI